MGDVRQLRSNEVYQLKISLDDIKPAIWRRIIVDPDIKLSDLHKVIQTVMGWYNCHLHQFRIDDTCYSIPDEDSPPEQRDSSKFRLNKLINKEKQKFHYEYDFGDGWDHTIVLEKILPRDKNKKYPVCIEGKRSCPPEDCGGPCGYGDIISVINNPDDEEYTSIMDWLGSEFNPDELDIEYINEMLLEKDYGCIEFYD